MRHIRYAQGNKYAMVNVFAFGILASLTQLG